MSLFKKKCEYCREKIEKGKEVFKDVRDLVFVGTKRKAFCCEGHADCYVREMDEHLKNSKSCKSGCCG